MKALDEISTEIFDVAKGMPPGEDSDTLFDASRELSEASHELKSIQIRIIQKVPERWGIWDERTKSVIANGSKKAMHDWVTGLSLDLMASYYDRFPTAEDCREYEEGSILGDVAEIGRLTKTIEGGQQT